MKQGNPEKILEKIYQQALKESKKDKGKSFFENLSMYQTTLSFPHSLI